METTKAIELNEISLPHFVGFYETYLNGDNEIDMFLEDHPNCNYDMLQFNYGEYKTKVGEWFTDIIESELNNELELNVSLTFTEVWSPREYNFDTDRVFAKIMFNSGFDKLIELINENFLILKERIQERFTSCSGFVSYHSNKINDWIIETNNWTKFDNDDQLAKLGFILGELIRIEKDYHPNNTYDMFQDEFNPSGNANINITEYISNYDKLEKKGVLFIVE